MLSRQPQVIALAPTTFAASYRTLNTCLLLAGGVPKGIQGIA